MSLSWQGDRLRIRIVMANDHYIVVDLTAQPVSISPTAIRMEGVSDSAHREEILKIAATPTGLIEVLRVNAPFAVGPMSFAKR